MPLDIKEASDRQNALRFKDIALSGVERNLQDRCRADRHHCLILLRGSRLVLTRRSRRRYCLVSSSLQFTPAERLDGSS